MGLCLLIIGLIFSLVYTIIYSSAFFIIETVNLNSPFFSIIGVISGIGGLISLIGALMFFLGRKEFGEKHHMSVNNALYICILSIVVTIIVTIIISFYVYTSISSSSDIDSASFVTILMVTIIISAILGALIYYFALVELMDERGKNILLIAISVSIIISVITSVYFLGLMENIFGSLSDYDSTSFNYMQNLGGISILSIIPSILFLYVLYLPYDRIAKGEIVPQTQSAYTNNYPSRMCPNCGRPIPNDALICPYCEKKFE